MKILFLSDNFPPETNAPATRLHDHAVRWVEVGHEVTVVTCVPNFPDGKVYPGYKNKWYQTENVSGIRVVRVKSYISANTGFLKRILDYASFMVTGFATSLFEPKPDIVIGTSPQFFCAIAAWGVAAVRRRPFVFELRDLWPASIIALNALSNRLAIRSLEKLEMFLYRRADAIVSVTQSFRTNLVARGIDEDKISVVLNGVDLRSYSSTGKDAFLQRELGLAGKFVVGYLGTHGMAHALDKVVDAAELAQIDTNIVFLFAGGGAEKKTVEDAIKRKRLSNVQLMPRQPKERMPALWSLCDVTVIPLRDNPIFTTVIPSKLFEAMGTGTPVIISLPDGEATAIVRKSGAGVVVPPENPRALANAVLALAKNSEQLELLSRNACHSAARYSRDAMATKMERILTKVVSHETSTTT